MILRSLAAVTTIGLAGCSSDSEEAGSKPTTDEPSSGDDGSGPEETATPTAEETEEQTEAGPTEAVIAIGDVVEGTDLSMVVRNVRKMAELGQFQQADSGNTFVVVNLAVKNTTDEKFLNFSGFLQTRLKDDEDYTYQQTIATTGQTLDGGQLAPGEVGRGDIVFEVPEEAGGLTLQFDFQAISFFEFDRVTVDLSKTADTIGNLTQNLKVDIHSVGDTVEYGDVSVTVNDVSVADQLGSFATPEEGNEYVVVDITTENNTGEPQHISTLLQMLIKDGTGRSYQEDLTATSQLDRAYEEGSPVADGEARRGKLAYQIEKGLGPLYWVFEFTLWTEGDKTFWKLR